MEKQSKFWDRHAKGYAKSKISDEASYQLKLKQTRDYMTSDMEVLELACGTGTTALSHAPYVKHIHGVDISEKMLEIAKSKAMTQEIKNVSFEFASIDEFCRKPRQYDMIMAHSIIHLVADRDDVIRSIFSMLKPGGVFVSSTACLADSMHWLRFVLPIGRALGLLPLVKFFSVSDLEESITKSGFRVDNQWQPGKGKSAFIIATKVT